jgi:hypothetical protein
MRRRLPRILLNAATAVSLGLCVATTLLWVRSYWRVDFAERIWPDAVVQVWSTSGLVALTRHDLSGRGYPAMPWSWTSEPHGRDDQDLPGWNHLRFGWERRPRGGILFVPHWAVAVGAGILPAWRVVGVTRRRRAAVRARAGRCPACGYDLRATPDRCPECGTATEAAGSAPAR